MKIIIFHEKHGKPMFGIKDGDETSEAAAMQKIALRVFQERDNDDWYEEEYLTATQKRYYRKAKDERDAKAALTFLISRQRYEYEGFEVDTIEVF
jgi:DsbC/DsbD-like thiol-disulfide interchange protein